MIEVPIYNQSGTKVDTFQLDPAKLGGEVRTNLLKQAVTMYHANQRQGTVRTLARGEVAGSTRKMFRQKGTGNARTGGIRNPIKKGVRMAGHMGVDQVTTRNHPLVRIDATNNILLIKGALPGPNGGLLFVRKAVTAKVKAEK